MTRSDGAKAGLDWSGLMQAGLRGLGLRPDQFWSLTPAELALMLGIEAGPPAMTRGRLAELAARYPDRPMTEPSGNKDN
jgi:uncharacterized phage protein (TIGR02216 family)